MHDQVRNSILQHHPRIFGVIHFFYTPIRLVKTFIIRRAAANKFLQKYSEIKKQDRKIFYFGIPEHNNLGDMAQTYCTRKWISDNYPEYSVLEINTKVSFDRKFIRNLSKLLQNEDIFIFQSGYCTRSMHMDHWMHLNMMRRFANQKALILPQTVKLEAPNDVAQAKDVFIHCSRLLFLARDRVSYDQAKAFTKDNQLVLFPDIVTTLIGQQKQPPHERKGVLLCIRNDDEKYYTDDEINAMISNLRMVIDIVDRTDTNSNDDTQSTYNHLEKYIREKVESFGKYQAVITDRYHGTIFSLIANTPVIIIKTNDHKVTAGYDWFKDIFSAFAVQKSNDLESACAMAKQIIQENITVDNSDYFMKNYYQQKLKDLFDRV